jgi:hypothetical protein
MIIILCRNTEPLVMEDWPSETELPQDNPAGCTWWLVAMVACPFHWVARKPGTHLGPPLAATAS